MLKIVHITDLHFAADETGALTPTRALELAADALEPHLGGATVHLVVSGDITTKGQRKGYEAALGPLKRFKERLSPGLVLTLPGNHDISPASSTPAGFNGFNDFALQFTEDPAQLYDRDHLVRSVEGDGQVYVLVNTAHHLDHAFGKVPMRALEEELATLGDGEAVVVVHHSPISSVRGGHAIVNAYDFLKLVARHQVKAVLHGHVHCTQLLEIGRRPTHLAGTGSLGFRPGDNMSNQFAVYTDDGNGSFTAQQFCYQADRNKFLQPGVDLP